MRNANNNDPAVIKYAQEDKELHASLNRFKQA